MTSVLCGSCAASFTLFKKKNRCNACRLFYCTACFKKGQNLPQRNLRHCLKCHTLSSSPYIPAELMLLTVKELKSFLQQINVSAAGCREKTDLVDVIMQHPRASTSTAQSTPTQRDNYNTSTSTNHNQPDTRPSRAEIDAMARQNLPRMMQTITDELRRPTHTDTSGLVESLFAGIDIGHLGEAHVNSQTTASGNSNQQYRYQDAEMRDESAGSSPSTVWSMKSGGSKSKGVHLDSIKAVEDIQKLSVRQLKTLLDQNFVDYTGCCEKEELVERTVMLWQSKKLNTEAARNDESLDGESNLCKVCMDNCVDCVLLECGHLVTCIECGKKLKECPMCRRNISRIVRVFKS